MSDRSYPTIQTPEDEFHAPDNGRETVNPAPEMEFSTPDVSQEFDQTSGVTEETKKESAFKRLNKIRRLVYGAAAIALGFVMLTPNESGKTEDVPSVTQAVAKADDEARPSASPAAAAPASEAPVTPAPTPVPTDTPVPEPVWKKPDAKAVFFSFSSEYHAWVLLSNPESVRSVTVELFERNLDELMESYSWEEGDPAIQSGILKIPAFDVAEFYFSHMDYYMNNNLEPEPEMEVAVLYQSQDSGQEESIHLSAEPAPEEGLYARYWGTGSFARENGYPDSFEVGTYDKSEDWRFVIDRPDLVTEPGIFSVRAEYGGRKVTEAECSTETKAPDPDLVALGLESEPNVILVIKRPDWMPEQGTLTLRITQYLAHYGCTLTKTLEIDFSDQIDDAAYGKVLDTEIGSTGESGS